LKLIAGYNKREAVGNKQRPHDFERRRVDIVRQIGASAKCRYDGGQASDG